MATKSKTAPDRDPIEEALDIGFGLGKEEERKRQTPKIEAARRGGQRTGRAHASRTIEQDRRERAAKEQARREVRRRRREEELASARRGAFASGQAKAKRDAAQQAQQSQPRRSSAPRRSSGASTGLTAPSFSLVGGGGSGIDRATSGRIIILVIGVSAIGVVAMSATSMAPTKTTINVGGENVTVPTHLRSLGGVFLAGTVALIVNEVSPGLGLALGLLLGFDVWLNTLTGAGGLFARLGGSTFGGGTTRPAKPLTNAPKNPHDASSKSMVAWIEAHPGQVPHPNAGPNDYWNTFARNTYANAQH